MMELGKMTELNFLASLAECVLLISYDLNELSPERRRRAMGFLRCIGYYFLGMLEEALQENPPDDPLQKSLLISTTKNLEKFVSCEK